MYKLLFTATLLFAVISSGKCFCHEYVKNGARVFKKKWVSEVGGAYKIRECVENWNE